MANFHALSIRHIERNTPDSVVISFDIPNSLTTAFHFNAGQYISLEATIEGVKVRRSYSICTAPHEKTLAVGIKKISQGVFSSYANAVLKEGDTLLVSEPEGRFDYVPKKTPETISAFAAGSGITPIMAILKTVLNAHPENRFHLVYANKTPERTMFYETLQRLKEMYADRLSVLSVFSQSHEEGALFGRIDQSVVHYFLSQNGTSDAYYLCGPEEMIQNVSDCLQNKGIPSEAILYELFYAKEKDDSNSSVAKSKDCVELTVVCDGVTTSFEMQQDEIVLDAVLNQKIDAPYSCQGGVCSSCIAKVTKGTAEMEKNEILTQSEVADGYILACQSRATTASVTVDFDEV